MTARILVVEDDPLAARLIEARLTAEYFTVIVMRSGMAALEYLSENPVDLIILDVLMPVMDGIAVCARVKSDPSLSHLPVIMVTALHDPQDRARGLEVGADDFITKPVSDVALISRVRSLVRLKMLTDELRLRATTYRMMGLDSGPVLLSPSDQDRRGQILLVEAAGETQSLASQLAVNHQFDLAHAPDHALSLIEEKNYELVIVDLQHGGFDGLRLCSQIRSLDRARFLPILAIADDVAETHLRQAYEIGINDYIARPVDRSELAARVRTQLRRKRYTDRLRDSVDQSIQLAVMDTLTGLHNRRYLETHLAAAVSAANERSRNLSLMMLDVDFFKAINDTYGHDAGDVVLQEVAKRVRRQTRGIDLVCRFGGEEFVVAMPDTDLGVATIVAERIRQRMCSEPVLLPDGATVTMTCSIGVTDINDERDTPEQMLKRADVALYMAKRDGRNRVVVEAA